ncbi:hypothetical protein GCM10010365_01010 [Streptomyces poonensis]|uniref:DUF3515 domain-containing protein n=1 Tax=Streptomyces poonensis TaxID=68255 RepID=A0A918P7G5_9ACTN|nr:hypothetical protein GCM10010365_01010 [Streptomyces poonensis]GLJ92305.1 hypothetical protein GCM10017589_49140 [Streptomyces poonensis]
MRHRRTGLSALVLLLATAGCSSADDSASVAVPSPGAKATELCQDLDKALPRKLDGLVREDPEPRSALTAAWGGSAIILRCGVPRPAEMLDPKASTSEVNGVAWLVQEQDDGGYVFTTGLRQAYVEVRFSKEQAATGAGPLVDFAAPVKKTIPEGIAD